MLPIHVPTIILFYYNKIQTRITVITVISCTLRSLLQVSFNRDDDKIILSCLSLQVHPRATPNSANSERVYYSVIGPLIIIYYNIICTMCVQYVRRCTRSKAYALPRDCDICTIIINIRYYYYFYYYHYMDMLAGDT